MHDSIINKNDIYLQDIICDAVMQNYDKTDLEIYNIVVELVDITSLDSVEKILQLIKLNRMALSL